MKINYFLTLLAVFSLVTLGCNQASSTNSMEKKDVMMEKEDAMEKSDAMGDEMMKKDEAMMEKQDYTGNVLAGTDSTKYIDFNKADYEKALKEKKKILLYFYANWCPICKREQPETFAAFNEINDADLIGFRVNYRDSDTDADEEALAKEFGVSYQHTKIILVNGQRVLKAPDSWNKERYLEELKKI